MDPTWLVHKTKPQTPIPVSRLRVKEGHIKIWIQRVPECQYTPDLVLFVNHMVVIFSAFCNQTQKSKLLSCRSTLSTWTLPSTALTVKKHRIWFCTCCTQISVVWNSDYRQSTINTALMNQHLSHPSPARKKKKQQGCFMAVWLEVNVPVFLWDSIYNVQMNLLTPPLPLPDELLTDCPTACRKTQDSSWPWVNEQASPVWI